jgi:hypothetical protein
MGKIPHHKHNPPVLHGLPATHLAVLVWIIDVLQYDIVCRSYKKKSTFV